MFIPTQISQRVLRYIFQESIILAEIMPVGVHEQTGAPIKMVHALIDKLVDKGWMVRTVVWRHAYCRLTDEGISELREYLGLNQKALPKSHLGQMIRADMIEGEKICD